MRVAALLAAALALGAAAASAQAPERGFFLVAKPSILDPNFSRTVVLVAHAPDGGTVGLILNRPTKQSLADLLPGNADLARFTEPLHFGGPVARVGLFAVFQAAASPGESLPVIDDVYIALQPATIEQLLRKPPAAVRFFVGYAGWGPGQLRAELERGDWWVVKADADTIFRKNTATLWDDLEHRARSVTARAGRDGAGDATASRPQELARYRSVPRPGAVRPPRVRPTRRPSRTPSRSASSRRGSRPSARTGLRGSPSRAGSRSCAGSPA